MLQIPTWSKVLTILILVAGVLIALPNALPGWVISRMPPFLPTGTVALGLDLQGGSYLLLEVEFDQVQKDRLETMMGDIRIAFRKARIGYTNLEATGDTVSLRVLDPSRYDEAKSILAKLNPVVGGSVLSVGTRDYQLTEPGHNQVVMRMTDEYKASTKEQILTESIEVVRRRIDQLGTREPTIERQGEDRILVQVPGLSDPSRLIKLLGTTARMTFQMVDDTADEVQAEKGIVPIGEEQLKFAPNPNKQGTPPPLVVERRVLVDGDRLTDAEQSFDPQTQDPDVILKFDTVGAHEFGDATKNNVGKKFAIVLDNQIIEAATIREPILGGNADISGGFSVQSATDLAVLLRAGALPAPLKVIEQRTVGPQLGHDQIIAGKYSTLAGLLCVAVFMVMRYGLAGFSVKDL